MSFEIGVGPNIRKSVYFDATVADGVRSFSVYNHMLIPGHFGAPEAEYDSLINGVVMWDVAAQRQVEIAGPDAQALVQYLTTRDISGTVVGQGRYVPICDHNGVLINDPVLLMVEPGRYWMSIADSDIALWAAGIAAERGLDVTVDEPDVSPLAVQGPQAIDVVADLFGDWIRDLRYFGFKQTELDGIPLILARSGWSKQGGYELYLQDGTQGTKLWNRVKSAGSAYGIRPGAPNDIERIESGLVSYGADCRLQTYPCTPFEMGLGGLVDFEKAENFVGRAALERCHAEGLQRQRTGFVIDGSPLGSFAASVPIYTETGETAGWLSEAVHSKRFGGNIGVGMLDLSAAQAPLHVVLKSTRRTVTPHVLPFL